MTFKGAIRMVVTIARIVGSTGHPPGYYARLVDERKRQEG